VADEVHRRGNQGGEFGGFQGEAVREGAQRALAVATAVREDKLVRIGQGSCRVQLVRSPPLPWKKSAGSPAP
jgi:hypothetical protein